MVSIPASEMTPEGIEPPIFGSGIRRVAIAPWSLSMTQDTLVFFSFDKQKLGTSVSV